MKRHPLLQKQPVLITDIIRRFSVDTR